MLDEPVTAFGSAIARLDYNPGEALRICEPSFGAIVAVMARHDQSDQTANKLASLPNAMISHIIHVGPARWLAFVERVSTSSIGDLQSALHASAHVIDQTGGYGLLELRGRDGRRLLQKGIFVDLAIELAQDGASICSVISHINVVVWNSGTDCLTIAVPRSFASSFWHWLTVSAAAENISISQ